MPCIGLGDEGEMATAALHFGVMHPSGYPLWTILAGIFSSLHFGNGAWMLNLFTGLSAAGAVGVFAVMASSTSAWMGVSWRMAAVMATSASLMLTFAEPIWSQAVIGKGTYSLHLFLMMALMFTCYLWIRTPQWKSALLWVGLAFTMAMSNHHMSLAMAGIPLVLIFLFKREMAWEYLIYILVTASIFFLGFAYLSESHDIWQIAVRFFYTSWVAALLVVFVQGRLREWKRGLLLPAVVLLGLLPYLYMPVSSSTNPPMNWSNTATVKGFYASINRSQYWGPLSEKIQDTLGRAMGVPPREKPKTINLIDQDNGSQRFAGFCSRLCIEALGGVSPIPFAGSLLAFCFIGRITREQRIWLLTILAGAFLSGFFEALMNPGEYDNGGWSIQKPWHGTFYACMFLISVIGVTEALRWSKGRKLVTALLIASLPVAAIYSFSEGYPTSSQRGHWFGWKIGHDLLSDLPKGALYMGGSDPGYFIPKYMVACESVERPEFKRDPSFDRHDIFVITQNMLAEDNYRQVCQMQYGPNRPDGGALGRWLGRKSGYPDGSIVIPSRSEATSVLGSLPESQWDDGTMSSSAIAEWVFLHNRDSHRVFMEEQYPMSWSYKYAMPHGLCYELNHDTLTTLPKQIVDRDIKWWDDYIASLKKMKGFEEDVVARRAFARMRHTGGNIYMGYNLNDAAKRAYMQELEICPDSNPASMALAYLLAKERNFEAAEEISKKALRLDPNSKILQGLVKLNEQRLAGLRAIPGLEAQLAANPSNIQAFIKELEIRSILVDKEKQDELVDRAIQSGKLTPAAWMEIVEIYISQGESVRAREVADAMKRAHPDSWKTLLVMAKVDLVSGNKPAAYDELRKAYLIGGALAKESVANDPAWDGVRSEREFQHAMEVGGAT